MQEMVRVKNYSKPISQNVTTKAPSSAMWLNLVDMGTKRDSRTMAYIFNERTLNTRLGKRRPSLNKFNYTVQRLQLVSTKIDQEIRIIRFTGFLPPTGYGRKQNGSQKHLRGRNKPPKPRSRFLNEP